MTKSERGSHRHLNVTLLDERLHRRAVLGLSKSVQKTLTVPTLSLVFDMHSLFILKRATTLPGINVRRITTSCA